MNQIVTMSFSKNSTGHVLNLLAITLFTSLFSIFTVQAQTDPASHINRLNELLQNYQGFGSIKAHVKSEYNTAESSHQDSVTPFRHSEVIAFFSEPRSLPMRVDYLSRKNWRNGLPYSSESRFTYVLANDFYAKIYNKRPLVRLVADENSDLPAIEYFETGTGFLLMHQNIFNEIPISDFSQKTNKYQNVRVNISEDTLEGTATLKIVFSRTNKGHDQVDTFFIAPQMGFALLRRKFVDTMSKQMRANLGKIRTAKNMAPMPEGGSEFLYNMSQFQKIDAGFLPLKSQRRYFVFGKLRDEIKINISSIHKTHTEEIKNAFSNVPEGHRVLDSRNGSSYLVGNSGLEWPSRAE